MFDETPLWMVDTPEALERMVARLGGARVIGVDTESDSFHHYQEKVCLLQFSDLDADYIVDPLAVPDLSPLAPILADPNVVKVFHGADYDIVCLKRDFGFQINNLFDTMIASQQLAFKRIGLADLIGEFFGEQLDKKYQRHDWASRPLYPEHVEYARGDTHWLLALREILERRLAKAGRLGRVREECRRLERREWEGRTFDEHGWMRVKTGGKQLDDKAKRVLRRVWLYRDGQARKLDRPPFKVLPDEVLVDVAVHQPSDEAALDRVFGRGKANMIRRHREGFLEAVRVGLQDDFAVPRQKPKRVAGGPVRLTGRLADRAFDALKDWRNRVVGADGENPMSVVSNGTLKSIVRSRPHDLEELAQVPDVRQWQVDAYGPALLEVLDEVAPRDAAPEPEPEDEPAEGGKRRRRRRRRRSTDA